MRKSLGMPYLVNKHVVWSQERIDTRLLKCILEALWFSIFRLQNWRIAKAC